MQRVAARTINSSLLRRYIFNIIDTEMLMFFLQLLFVRSHCIITTL